VVARVGPRWLRRLSVKALDADELGGSSAESLEPVWMEDLRVEGPPDLSVDGALAQHLEGLATPCIDVAVVSAQPVTLEAVQLTRAQEANS
jgi:hypothetical protein